MSQAQYLFEYCQKIVVLSESLDSVLLARRARESDYDGTYSLIGGKLETKDQGLMEGLRREKNEEIGKEAVLVILPNPTFSVLFTKSSGQKMVLPHYVAVFKKGEIVLSDEYSDYKWVKLAELNNFEPKIESIPKITDWAVDTIQKTESGKLIEI